MSSFYSDRSKHTIKNIITLKNDNPNYELEIRISLSEPNYIYMINEFGFDKEMEYDIKFNNYGLRTKIYKDSIIHESKKEIEFIIDTFNDNDNLAPYKISIANEMELSTINDTLPLIRHIKRHIKYVDINFKKQPKSEIYNSGIEISLSQITQNGNIDYKLEIEFLDKEITELMISSSIAKIYNYIFTINNNLLTELNAIIGNVLHESPQYKDRYSFLKPVNIKRYEIKELCQYKYYMTNKLDGMKVNIIRNGNCLYVCSMKMGFILYKIKSNTDNGYINDGGILDFIYDAEYDSVNNQIWLLDVVSKKTDFIKTDAIDLMQEFEKLLTNKTQIKISYKVKYPLWSENFEDIKNKLYTKFKKSETIYNQFNDGFIFEPNAPYLMHENKFKTYKWKNPESISIDVKVIRDHDDSNYIYYKCFDGSNQFVEKIHYLRIPITESIKDNTIVELIYKNKEFKVMRIRPDKKFGNSTMVINSTLEDMFDPITLDEFNNIYNKVVYAYDRGKVIPTIKDLKIGKGKSELNDNKPHTEDDDSSEEFHFYYSEDYKKHIFDDRDEFTKYIYYIYKKFGDEIIISNNDYYLNNYIETIPTIFTTNIIPLSRDITNFLFESLEEKTALQKTIVPYKEIDIYVLNRKVCNIQALPLISIQNNAEKLKVYTECIKEFKYNNEIIKLKMIKNCFNIIDVFHNLYSLTPDIWQKYYMYFEYLKQYINIQSNTQRPIQQNDYIDVLSVIFSNIKECVAIDITALNIIDKFNYKKNNNKTAVKINRIQLLIKDVDSIQNVLNNVYGHNIYQIKEDTMYLLPFDVILKKYIINYNNGGKFTAIGEMFNSLQYDAIPTTLYEFNNEHKDHTWTKISSKVVIKVASPLVLLRFAYIEQWKYITLYNSNKLNKSYFDISIASVQYNINRFMELLTFKNFIQFIDFNHYKNWTIIGEYKDPTIYKRIIVKELKNKMDKKMDIYTPFTYFENTGKLLGQ